MSTLPILLLLGLSVATAACRLEERTPSGSARPGDDVAIAGAVTALYAALASNDTTGLDDAAAPAATVALGAEGNGFLIPLHTVWTVPGARAGNPSLRIVRSEVRPDGELAVVRVVVATRPPGADVEAEASDLLTLVRREGRWQLAHVAFGSWRGRAAP